MKFCTSYKLLNYLNTRNQLINAQEATNTNVTAAGPLTSTESDHEAPPHPPPQRNGRRRKKKSVTISGSSPTKEVRSRIDTGLNSREVAEAASRRKIKFSSNKPQKLDISERPEWK